MLNDNVQGVCTFIVCIPLVRFSMARRSDSCVLMSREQIVTLFPPPLSLFCQGPERKDEWTSFRGYVIYDPDVQFAH